MANTVYITAGLPVPKEADQTPTPGKNTVYITAGLPPQPEESTSTHSYFKIGKLLLQGHENV